MIILFSWLFKPVILSINHNGNQQGTFATRTGRRARFGEKKTYAQGIQTDTGMLQTPIPGSVYQAEKTSLIKLRTIVDGFGYPTKLSWDGLDIACCACQSISHSYKSLYGLLPRFMRYVKTIFQDSDIQCSYSHWSFSNTCNQSDSPIPCQVDLSVKLTSGIYCFGWALYHFNSNDALHSSQLSYDLQTQNHSNAN